VAYCGAAVGVGGIGVAVTILIIGVGVCSGITGSDSEQAIIREKQRATNKIVFLTLILSKTS
jgi:F0F1-type ATP synthase membrane subunit c/vacuolar-type H+-ATPase subunit K